MKTVSAGGLVINDTVLHVITLPFNSYRKLYCMHIYIYRLIDRYIDIDIWIGSLPCLHTQNVIKKLFSHSE